MRSDASLSCLTLRGFYLAAASQPLMRATEMTRRERPRDRQLTRERQRRAELGERTCVIGPGPHPIAADRAGGPGLHPIAADRAGGPGPHPIAADRAGGPGEAEDVQTRALAGQP